MHITLICRQAFEHTATDTFLLQTWCLHVSCKRQAIWAVVMSLPPAQMAHCMMARNLLLTL